MEQINSYYTVIKLLEFLFFSVETSNGNFYKAAKYRTSNTRILENGEVAVYDCIEAEFRAAERIYSASDIFVEPYELDFNNSGEPVGYLMEELEGQPLEWYLNPERSGRPEDTDPGKIAKQLGDFMESISQADEPHGDLEPGNIMVHEDSSITVFDPVGYPEDFKWSEGELRKDRQNVNDTIERLEELQDRGLTSGLGTRTDFRP